MKTELTVAILVAALAPQAQAAESAENIYKACTSVFNAMSKVSDKAFGKSIDSDKIMSSLICPLTESMASSISEAIKGTLDGSASDSFSKARDDAQSAGKKFNKIVWKDNKYVCPSMNKLTKDLDHMKRDSAGDKSPDTSIKDTYDILGKGIKDTSDACMDNSKTTDVICPVVEDLERAVKMLSKIIDSSANGQKLASEVVDKINKLLDKVDCKQNGKLKDACNDLIKSSDIKTKTSDTSTTKSDDKDCTTSSSTDSSTTSTTSSSTSCETTNSDSKHKSDSSSTEEYVSTSTERYVVTTGPNKSTKVEATTTPTGAAHKSSGKARSGDSDASASATKTGHHAAAGGGSSASKTTSGPSASESDCDCFHDGAFTTTNSEGSVITSVPGHSQTGDSGNHGGRVAAPFGAAFAALVLPLL